METAINDIQTAQTSDVINFSCYKRKISPIYIIREYRSTSILFLRSLSHQLVFCLILDNKICLRSSSSSRWSFNISAKDKVNQKSTLRLQFIKIYPYSPSFYIFHCRVLGNKNKLKWLVSKKQNGHRLLPSYYMGRGHIFLLQEKLITSGACGTVH